jgi:hypothetical protein
MKKHELHAEQLESVIGGSGLGTQHLINNGMLLNTKGWFGSLPPLPPLGSARTR